MKNMIRRVCLPALSLLTVAVLASCGCDHVEVTDATVAPTCTATGLTEGKHCSECGKVFAAQENVPALGHTPVADPGKVATCTESGLTEGQHCSTCNEVLTAQEIIPIIDHTSVVDSVKAATCTVSGLTEGAHCGVCGTVLVVQENIPAKGHSTTSGICTECGLSIGDWKISYYVDNFKQPTDEGYVVNKSLFVGIFSNSATTNSELKVQMVVDSEDITFFLYEYGRSQVKNYSSRNSEKYSIVMRIENEKDYELSGFIYPGGDRICIAEKDKGTVLDAMQRAEKISFYMKEDDSPTTSYLFTLSTSNFSEEYEKIKQ